MFFKYLRHTTYRAFLTKLRDTERLIVPDKLKSEALKEKHARLNEEYVRNKEHHARNKEGLAGLNESLQKYLNLVSPSYKLGDESIKLEDLQQLTAEELKQYLEKYLPLRSAQLQFNEEQLNLTEKLRQYTEQQLQLFEELRTLEIEVQQHVIAASELQDSKNEYDKIVNYDNIVSKMGLLFAFLGFELWYLKIQQYQDIILIHQAQAK